MKKIQFIIGIVAVLFSLQATAQLSVNVSIGSRPQPAVRYVEVEEPSYYYYPEIEAYYDVNSSVYIYYGNGGWTRSRYLPEYCNNYDFDRGYKVMIDYRGRSPYAYFENHKVKYHRNYHRNYRDEYYHPRQQRRNDRVIVVQHDHRKDKYKRKHKNHDDDDEDDD